jgi:arylsulfatase A-like enzyme
MRLSRRDFLKLAAIYSSSLAAVPFIKHPSLNINALDRSLPNIIIILFDTTAARNLSLYGYPRKTTPNLERFAEKAVVYHAHYSAANFTTPATASLLTGTYSWTHRAVDFAGLIKRQLEANNIFHALDGYHRTAFTQHMWVNYLLNQFRVDIDQHFPPTTFSFMEDIFGNTFVNDLNSVYRSYDDFLFDFRDSPSSLILGTLNRLRFMNKVTHYDSAEYPHGLPHSEIYPIYFRIPDVYNGVLEIIKNLVRPSFAYFHLWSPHSPYRPSKDFLSLFQDTWRPSPKPVHPLARKIPQKDLNRDRRTYDQYVADVDHQFGILMDQLAQNGILDNSYVIITSDHGEMFERGVEGHVTPLLYDSVIQVPLLISAPGQSTRKDIFSPTNSVDVLPTLCKIAGVSAPQWAEGTLLPGFGGLEDPSRSMYSMVAKGESAFEPFNQITIAMRKGKYKLIYYTGYDKYNGFELYDMDADPEELNNLYPINPGIALPLKDELLSKFNEANKV